MTSFIVIFPPTPTGSFLEVPINTSLLVTNEVAPSGLRVDQTHVRP